MIALAHIQCALLFNMQPVFQCPPFKGRPGVVPSLLHQPAAGALDTRPTPPHPNPPHPTPPHPNGLPTLVTSPCSEWCCVCRQRHVNKQQVLQRAMQRMRRSELSRCFYLWRDRFGEVDDYARKRRKVWASSIFISCQNVSSHAHKHDISRLNNVTMMMLHSL